MLGVTVGYHRLISHRSFKCPKLVEYFFVLGGYLAFEGSPIWWAAIHRAHHRYEETELDPHSPRFGIFRAFVGWTFEGKYADHIQPDSQCRDLTSDKLYAFFEQGGSWERAHLVNFAIGVIFRLTLWMLFGLPVALGSTAAGLISMAVPLLLNVVCHIPKLGYRNFQTNEDSVNVWWMGLLAMGEGWHNNHHKYPGSARMGMTPFELDVSWLTICFLKRLGLIGWVNDPGTLAYIRESEASHATIRTPVPGSSRSAHRRDALETASSVHSTELASKKA